MNYKIILTGAMGSGKSTVLQELRKQKMMVVDEPARQILAEQRAIQGRGVPEIDADLFSHLLLSRAMYLYSSSEKTGDRSILFDRGIADNIAYARLFGLDLAPFEAAARAFQYNKNVFFFPAWEEIYRTDDERKMSYSEASAFGEEIRTIYLALGYDLIEVPCLSVKARVEFIMDRLNDIFNEGLW